MNKQSILIIAGLMGAIGGTSVASAMEFQLLEFQLYGSVRAGVHIPTTGDVMTSDVLGSDGNTVVVLKPVTATQTLTPDTDNEGTSALEWGVGNAGDRIGIKGSGDLGNGISAGFVFERGTDGSTDDDNELNRRHQNAWIKGGWGKLTYGQQDNPYRNVANWDQASWLGGRGHVGDGGSRPNGIRYDSGGSGPFSISVMGTASFDDEAQDSRQTQVRYADDVPDSKTGGALDNNRYILLNHPEVESVDGLDSVIVAAHYKISNAATINLGVRYNRVESNRLGTEVDGQYSNAALSANGSAGALDWYIGYAMSSDNYKAHTIEHRGLFPRNENPGGNLPPIGVSNTTDAEAYISKRFVPHDAATLGLFLSWSLDESNLVYLEYENVSQDGADEALGDLGLTAALLGYSHSISPNSTFFVEIASRDHESELTADTSAILAVIKVDF